MAAGLSVKEENIYLLRKALNSKCTLSDEDIIPVIKIDSPLEIKYLDEGLVEEVESLRPFGKGNGSPMFAVKNLKVSRVFFIGKDKKFMKFRFVIPGTFGYVEGLNLDKYGEEKFLKLVDSGYADFNMDIIYYPTINEFNGKRNIQLNVKNFRL